MLKALFKKQFSEMFSATFKNRKTGQRLNKSGIIAISALLAFAYMSLGLFFFELARSMTGPFSGTKLSYLPFTVMSIAAFSVCIFVIGIYSSSILYNAKDNELLLSMPIPPSKILFVRITVLFFSCLFLSSLLLIPTLIAYIIDVSKNVIVIISGLIGIFFFALIVTAASALLGFIIAFITSKVKRKNIVSVFLTISFLALYYYFYFRARSIINSVIKNGLSASKAIKKWGYLFYLFGKAGTGDLLYLFLLLIVSAAAFGLLIFILSKTFYKITGGVPIKRRGKKVVTASRVTGVKAVLLKREFARFFSSTVYLINVGLGSLLMIVGAFAIIIFNRDINRSIDIMLNSAPDFVKDNILYLKTLVIIVFSAFLGSTVYYTAPSISMEGNSFWIVRTAPVKAADILNAKIKTHMLLGAVPGVLLVISASIVLNTGVFGAITNSLFILSFILFTGVIGLYFNLKMPNFDWTDATVPVKQSIPVTISFLMGLGTMISVAIIGFALKGVLRGEILGLILAIIFALVSFIIYKNINKNAEKIFLEIA